MASKKTTRKIREEGLARYDEVTRRLEERIARGLAELQRKKRRESS